MPDTMQWKIGYGLKANVANAILQSTLDSGDLIITSDEGKEQIGFVKPDNSVVWLKAQLINSVFESLTDGQAYIQTDEAYAGQTIAVKDDSGEYHLYIIQPSDAGYTLKAISGSNTKQYVVIGTRPESNQEQGVIYIDTNVGYIWNGSDWQKIFEDASLVATKEYVDTMISEIVNTTPGIVDGTDHILPTSDYKAGQTWRVAADGTYAGAECEAGDLIICLNDYIEGSASNADFMVLQANIDGAVSSSSDTSVDGNIVVFDGVTGKIIKDSNIALSTLQDTIDKAHEHTNKSQLDSFTKTQTELLQDVSNEINNKIGDLGESSTVVDYVAQAVGSGGVDISAQINNAIATSKAYTDSALTITEF